jgi:hypothetical protein
MDCLVASPEDMRLLELGGVLVNQMSGTSEAGLVGFSACLCAEAHLAANNYYFAGVIGKVNKYRRSRWPWWRVVLVRNYGSNPWMATSLAVLALLLVITVIQTFFASYSYFKAPKQN